MAFFSYNEKYYSFLQYSLKPVSKETSISPLFVVSHWLQWFTDDIVWKKKVKDISFEYIHRFSPDKQYFTKCTAGTTNVLMYHNAADVWYCPFSSSF